jgi:hypothetical protein
MISVVYTVWRNLQAVAGLAIVGCPVPSRCVCAATSTLGPVAVHRHDRHTAVPGSNLTRRRFDSSTAAPLPSEWKRGTTGLALNAADRRAPPRHTAPEVCRPSGIPCGPAGNLLQLRQ